MIHSTALLVIIAALAVARFTRLVVADAITEPIRAWIDRRLPSSISYLVNCSWCASIWVGFAAAGVLYPWHDTWPVQVALLGLAFSQCAAFAALICDRLEAGP